MSREKERMGTQFTTYHVLLITILWAYFVIDAVFECCDEEEHKTHQQMKYSAVYKA